MQVCHFPDRLAPMHVCKNVSVYACMRVSAGSRVMNGPKFTSTSHSSVINYPTCIPN